MRPIDRPDTDIDSRLAQMPPSVRDAFNSYQALVIKLGIARKTKPRTKDNQDRGGISVYWDNVYAWCDIHTKRPHVEVKFYSAGKIFDGCSKSCNFCHGQDGCLMPYLDESNLDKALWCSVLAAQARDHYQWQGTVDDIRLAIAKAAGKHSKGEVDAHVMQTEPTFNVRTDRTSTLIARKIQSPVCSRDTLTTIIAAFLAAPEIAKDEYNREVYRLAEKLKLGRDYVLDMIGRLSKASNPLEALSDSESQLLSLDDKARLEISDLDLLVKGTETLKNYDAEYWAQRVAKFEGKAEISQATLTLPRPGQQIFRGMILTNYGYTCCISGLRIPELLEASHIVGWAESAKDRLNPRNGLCLAPSLHAAFDQGLLTVTADGIVYVRKSVRNREQRIRPENDTLSRWHGRRIIQPSRSEHAPDPALLAKHHDTFGLTEEIKAAKL